MPRSIVETIRLSRYASLPARIRVWSDRSVDIESGPLTASFKLSRDDAEAFCAAITRANLQE